MSFVWHSFRKPKLTMDHFSSQVKRLQDPQKKWGLVIFFPRGLWGLPRTPNDLARSHLNIPMMGEKPMFFFFWADHVPKERMGIRIFAD